MARLLVPSLAVLLLAALIGCGGETGSGIDTTGGDTSGNDGGGGGSTDLRATPGNYTLSLSGSDNGTPVTTYTGTGTGVAASDGTVTLDYSSVASGGVPGTTTRRLVVVFTAAGGVSSGSLTVNSGTPRNLNSVALTGSASAGYVLTTITQTEAGAAETDRFSLALQGVPTGTYSGNITAATDSGNASHSGSGTATIVSGSSLQLTYNTLRSGGVTKTHSLGTTLQSNGTFTGTLSLGTQNGTTPVTGTWSLSGANLVLTLRYTDIVYISRPTVSETLTLARQ